MWRKRLPERNGQACRVLAHGRMNSVLVEFNDGHRVITSRYAVRKLDPAAIASAGAGSNMKGVLGGT
jgi:hypothetical protein